MNLFEGWQQAQAIRQGEPYNRVGQQGHSDNQQEGHDQGAQEKARLEERQPEISSVYVCLFVCVCVCFFTRKNVKLSA